MKQQDDMAPNHQCSTCTMSESVKGLNRLPEEISDRVTWDGCRHGRHVMIFHGADPNHITCHAAERVMRLFYPVA